MIFLDRSLPKSVARALQAVRSDVQWLEDIDGLTANSPDEEWLELAGRNGWLVVTRDRHISWRSAERAAAEAFGVGMFVIREKRALNRWELAKIIVCQMDKWERQFQTTLRPFIYEFTKRGDLKRIL
jgi:hypothetical protein